MTKGPKKIPLGVVRTRNNMLNLNDVYDTCRIHRKGLGLDSCPNFINEVKSERMAELLSVLLHSNPDSNGDDFLDNHAETLGVGDDKYAHPIIALYLGIYLSPVIAVHILKRVDWRGVFNQAKSEKFDENNVLIDSTEAGEVNLIELKQRKGLYISKVEQVKLRRYYKKHGIPENMRAVLKNNHVVLQDSRKTSAYTQVVHNRGVNELEANKRPFKKGEARYSGVFSKLKDKAVK